MYSQLKNLFSSLTIIPIVSSFVLTYHAQAIQIHNQQISQPVSRVIDLSQSNDDTTFSFNDFDSVLNALPDLSKPLVFTRYTCSEEALQENVLVKDIDSLLADKSISDMRYRRFKRVLNRKMRRYNSQNLRLSNSITVNSDDSSRVQRRKRENLRRLAAQINEFNSTEYDAETIQQNFSAEKVSANARATQDIVDNLLSKSTYTKDFLQKLRQNTLESLSEECSDLLSSIGSQGQSLLKTLKNSSRSIASTFGGVVAGLLIASLVVVILASTVALSVGTLILLFLSIAFGIIFLTFLISSTSPRAQKRSLIDSLECVFNTRRNCY